MKQLTFFGLFLLIVHLGLSQNDSTLVSIKIHEIESKHLNKIRTFWVSLPMNYDSSQNYPVIYVLDAEWRFDLIRALAYDLSGNKKIPKHIVVGIPHVNWEFRRGIDLTFSESRMEYDGEPVDSTWYNATNSGGGQKFFDYLRDELIPQVDEIYPTNQFNILVGHSYGGYFGAYILGLNQPFKAFQLYDPSIWYSAGEVINRLDQFPPRDSLNVFITFQPEPSYHAQKIKDFVEELDQYPKLRLGIKRYPDETHNSLFMNSFLQGMKHLYGD